MAAWRDDDMPRPVTPLLRKRRRPAFLDEVDPADRLVRDWELPTHDREVSDRTLYPHWFVEDERIGWTKDAA